MESESILLHNGIFSQRRAPEKEKKHLDAVLKMEKTFFEQEVLDAKRQKSQFKYYI